MATDVSQYDLEKIRRVSRGVASRFHCDPDELLTSGWIGLNEAREKFNSTGVKFWTFADHHVRGRMMDQLRAERGLRSDRSRVRHQSDAALEFVSSRHIDEVEEQDQLRHMLKPMDIRQKMIANMLIDDIPRKQMAQALGVHEQRVYQEMDLMRMRLGSRANRKRNRGMASAAR